MCVIIMAPSQPGNESVGYMITLSSYEGACVDVSSDGVTLMSPAIPVKEGQDVPLHCRTGRSASNIQATFFKNGTIIGDGAAGQMTIQNFSASDQGPYWCKTNERESPHSWLHLEGKYPNILPLLFCLRFGSVVYLLIQFMDPLLFSPY